MKRSGPLRRTRIKSRPNKRDPEVDGPQCALARRMCCCSCGSPPPSHPDHLLTVGARGKDRGNATPLCFRCHDERHRLGPEQFEIERGPFRIALPMNGGFEVYLVEYESLKAVALELERLAYP